MGVQVTVELPEELVERARVVAARTHRPFEKVIEEWLDHAAMDVRLEGLADSEIIRLCKGQMGQRDQKALTRLLARQKEALLKSSERRRLDQLMEVYRRGLVRKAKAFKIAAERGIRTLH